MASSATYGAPIGVFGLLLAAQAETKCVHNICAPSGVSHVLIFTLKLQYIHSWWIVVILIGEKPKYPPNGVLCQGKDSAGSGISGLYLLFKPISALLCRVFEQNSGLTMVAPSPHRWKKCLPLYPGKVEQVCAWVLNDANCTLSKITLWSLAQTLGEERYALQPWIMRFNFIVVYLGKFQLALQNY